MTNPDSIKSETQSGATLAQIHRYDAFISYSHKADSELANVLQVRLERWARPWFAARTAKVFRDQVSLTATPHLWTTIARSLDKSKYLILLASTDSAKSKWVPREIAYWLTEGKCDTPEELTVDQVVQDRADRMMIVLTEGEIKWSHTDGDFDWGTTSALHPVLRKLTWQPLWTDLRWARGVKAKQIEADERFTEPVLKLLSPIRGKTPQELLDSNDKEQKRAVSLFRRLSIGLAVGFILALISGYVAYQQTLELGLMHESEIQRFSAEAVATRAEYPVRSVLLAAEAVKRNRFNGKPPLLVAERALRDALSVLNGKSIPSRLKSVSDLRFSKDGKRLIAIDNNYGQDAMVVDLATLSVVPISLGNKDRLFMDDFGEKLASWSDEGTIKVWRANALETPIMTFHHPLGPAQSHERHLAFSPDGKYIGTVHKDTAHLWTVSPKNEDPVLLPGQSILTTRLQFSRESNQLRAFPKMGPVMCWNIESDGATAVQEMFSTASKTEVAFDELARFRQAYSPESGHYADLLNFDTIHIWENDDRGKSVATLKVAGSSFENVCFSDDGKYIAAAGTGVKSWLWKVAADAKPVILGHDGWLNEIAFSPDSKFIAGGTRQGSIWIWNCLQTDRLHQHVNLDNHAISSLVFDATNKHVFLGNDLGTVSHIPIGKADSPVLLPDMHTAWLKTLAISETGNLLASSAIDGRSILWKRDANGWSPTVLEFAERDRHSTSFTFSSTAAELLAADQFGTIWRWQLPNPGVGQVQVRHVKGEVFNSCAFSPTSGQVILGGTKGTVELIDMAGAKRLTTLPIGDRTEVTSCAFSPHGEYFAYAYDGFVEVRRSTPPYENVRRLFNEGGVNAMVFCPGNDRIIVGGRIVRMYSLQRENERGEELEMGVREPNDSIQCMALDSNGQWLSVGMKNGEVHFWDLNTNSLIDEASVRVNRNLDLEEWQRYFPREPFLPTFKNIH